MSSCWLFGGGVVGGFQAVSSGWYSSGVVVIALRMRIAVRSSSTLLVGVGAGLISVLAGLVMVSRCSAVVVPVVVIQRVGGVACVPCLVYRCPVGLVKCSTVRSGSGRTCHWVWCLNRWCRRQ